MGGCKSKECNALAQALWVWCMGRKIWLSADPGSRHFNDNIDWQLNKQIFDKIYPIWGVPDVDMFASMVSKQLPKYVSWKPDSEAVMHFHMTGVLITCTYFVLSVYLGEL